MSSYWVNFITKGDPNGSGLPHWPEYKDLSNSKVMVLGDTPEVGVDGSGDEADLLCWPRSSAC